MGDRMTPISFNKLFKWVFSEYKTKGSIFGIKTDKFYKNKSLNYYELFGEKLSTCIGPAAGPHSQLTQNIVASYLTGSRFIELKTVQTLDGEDLPVSKPCILAEDECYNVEWSTELTVNEAFNEYVKAWFLLHVLMKELDISVARDFTFNMSVGYDLDGIKSNKINGFIDGLIDASSTNIWKECTSILSENLKYLNKFTLNDLNSMSSRICNSITLSTLHGCPPDEIERIANYLLKEKNINTFIKMNPTLLGESFVKDTFKHMGFDYITLNSHHFNNDLQFNDAINMLRRLKENAKQLGLEIGVKLTNTLPTKILNNELPGEEMYMSGRSLYPLSLSLAYKLSKEFEGDLKISYSGGADVFNINDILETGIMPITFATTLLKPGGYERIKQLAKSTEVNNFTDFSRIDVEKLDKLKVSLREDKHYKKSYREYKNKKINSELPILDCGLAPCSNGCPINQQIPEYISLVGDKKYKEAFDIIINDNTSPAITSKICNHTCQNKCNRIDYDQSINIRSMKNLAVIKAQENYIENLQPKGLVSTKKVVIIGAGVAGLATALYLRRNGLDVTVIEKRHKPYGVIQYVIPEFRIDQRFIDMDFNLAKKAGVKFKFGVKEEVDINDLKTKYDYVVLAIGTWESITVNLEDGNDKTINALEFLESAKYNKNSLSIGNKVVVIGGGDVAMDAARAAKRVPGVSEVSVVYRRTIGYMPASKEELNELLNDGIEIKELLAPKSFKGGKLKCTVMSLGEKDSKGRRNVYSSNIDTEIEADTVILAVGSKLETSMLINNNIVLNSNGYPVTDKNGQVSLENVYVAGDMKKGPATIVNAIADGKMVAKDILSKENIKSDFINYKSNIIIDEMYKRKGILKEASVTEEEANRCLGCNSICELCVDVCPNRANIAILVNSDSSIKHQILHIDGMCNECGNCVAFCPHQGAPYKDKFTFFWSNSDFINSTNNGFVLLDNNSYLCNVRLDGKIVEYIIGEKNIIPAEFENIIRTFFRDYKFII